MNPFRTAFTVNRPAAGSFVKGKWVQSGTMTQITIMASVQPVKGLDLQLVPEARRNGQIVKIFTDTMLQILTPSTNPDILLAFGYSYEVITVEPWQSNIINHYKCFGMKIE